MATEAKAFEAKHAVSNGAQEVDMVLNVGALKERNDSLVEQDIRAVKEACGSALLKVILETCLLSDEEKERACRLAVKAGADFVKTSTGFSTGGATAHDVALMRKTVGPNVGVKASGGIRTREDALSMIDRADPLEPKAHPEGAADDSASSHDYRSCGCGPDLAVYLRSIRLGTYKL